MIGDILTLRSTTWITITGVAGGLAHVALSLLATVGMSLGRQSDDPWSTAGEVAMVTSLYGSLAVIVVAGLNSRFAHNRWIFVYACIWLVIATGFLSAFVFEDNADALTNPLVLVSPAIASTSVLLAWLVTRLAASGDDQE